MPLHTNPFSARLALFDFKNASAWLNISSTPKLKLKDFDKTILSITLILFSPFPLENLYTDNFSAELSVYFVSRKANMLPRSVG